MDISYKSVSHSQPTDVVLVYNSEIMCGKSTANYSNRATITSWPSKVHCLRSCGILIACTYYLYENIDTFNTHCRDGQV